MRIFTIHMTEHAALFETRHCYKITDQDGAFVACGWRHDKREAHGQAIEALLRLHGSCAVVEESSQ